MRAEERAGFGTERESEGARERGIRQPFRSLSRSLALSLCPKALPQVAAYAALLLLSAVFLLPFLWMLSASLKTEASVYDYPPDLIPHEPVGTPYPDALETITRADVDHSIDGIDPVSIGQVFHFDQALHLLGQAAGNVE